MLTLKGNTSLPEKMGRVYIASESGLSTFFATSFYYSFNVILLHAYIKREHIIT